MTDQPDAEGRQWSGTTPASVVQVVGALSGLGLTVSDTLGEAVELHGFASRVVVGVGAELGATLDVYAPSGSLDALTEGIRSQLAAFGGLADRQDPAASSDDGVARSASEPIVVEAVASDVLEPFLVAPVASVAPTAAVGAVAVVAAVDGPEGGASSRSVGGAPVRRPLAVGGLVAGMVVAVVIVLVGVAVALSRSSMPEELATADAGGSTTAEVTTSAVTVPAEVTTSAEPVAPEPTPPQVDPAAIRAVDLANMVFPAGSCGTAGSGGWDNALPIPMVDGQGESGDHDGPIGYAQAAIDPAAALVADLDGDGIDDVVLPITCNGGGTSTETFALPLKLVDGQLQIIGAVLTPVSGSFHGGAVSRSAAGRAGPDGAPLRIVLDGTAILVPEVYDRGDEPMCCLTGVATIRWTWDGTAWQPQLDAASSPVGLDPASLSTDGIAPLVFGSTVAEAESVTGRPATPCALGGDGLLIDGALPGVTLVFRDGVLFAYTAKEGSVSTPSGGHVGMSARDLVAAIPYAERADLYGSPIYVVRSDGRSLVFLLDSNGVVYAITAGPTSFAEDIGELC